MPAIESPSNPRVAATRRAIERGQAMPLEGARILSEALDAGVVPEVVFHTEGSLDPAALARVAAWAVTVSERVLERLSELASSRGVFAVAPVPERALDALPDAAVAIVLDGVQDPTNVGAIVRTAEALGAGAALLTKGTASPYSARALRASAGSAFRLPIATGLSTEHVVDWAKKRSIALVGAEAHGGEPPSRLSATRPLALVIGSEGRGISPELESALDRRVTISLAGRVESLNASVAAALVLYSTTSRI